jgi:hypothetical protein
MLMREADAIEPGERTGEQNQQPEKTENSAELNEKSLMENT